MLEIFHLKKLLTFTMKPPYQKKREREREEEKKTSLYDIAYNWANLKRRRKTFKNSWITTWPIQFQGNDVIRDQSLGKINFKTSASVSGRWRESRTFRVRRPGFKSISATSFWQVIKLPVFALFICKMGSEFCSRGSHVNST